MFYHWQMRSIPGKILLYARAPGARIQERTICWYYPHEYGSGHKPSAAVRNGNCKLIWHLMEDRVELYDPGDDIYENIEISRQFPDKTRELEDYLENWISETPEKHAATF